MSEDKTDSPMVVVLGDVITDIIVQQTQALVSASDTRSSIAIRVGGSAANLATWLATSGLEVHFIGRVGNDPFGLFHQQEFEKFGVVPHLSLDARLSTGTIVALVEAENGERHMLTDRGANRNLGREDIPWEVFQAGPGNCFHLSGYSLLEKPAQAVALAVLERARQSGMLISIDPSSTSLLQEIGPELFLEWTRGANFCFPNLEEGQLLSGQNNPRQIVAFLTNYYGEVILKLGGGGALWAKQGSTSVEVAALPVAVVNCTGAGDAFGAGFLAERLKGASPAQALQNGARLAAKVVAQIGARPNLT